MDGAPRLVIASLVVAVVCGVTLPARAGAPQSVVTTDLHGLYQRLQPGMTVEQVADAAGDGGRLRASAPPVTSWLVWTPPVSGRPTGVLRATFRAGRLTRLEYEAFGDEYRRLVKGEAEAEISQEELNRLRRRNAQLEGVTGGCRETLEAYHHLILGAQERLTREEQAAWVRALERRRAVELQLNALSPR